MTICCAGSIESLRRFEAGQRIMTKSISDWRYAIHERDCMITGVNAVTSVLLAAAQAVSSRKALLLCCTRLTLGGRRSSSGRLQLPSPRHKPDDRVPRRQP